MKYLLLIVVFALLSGCSARNAADMVSFSALGSGELRQQEELVAKAVETLARRYPKSTAFEVLYDNGHDNGDFGAGLEDALRQAGFTVGAGQEEAGKTLKLQYIVDYLESFSLYMSVRLSDGFAFSILGSVQNSVRGEAQSPVQAPAPTPTTKKRKL